MKAWIRTALLTGAQRRHLIGGLVRFYEDVLCREFDPRSGRFRPLDGAPWDIRHHYAIAVPALLHGLADPLNPHRGSRLALEMCVRAGDRLARTQDRFGRFPEEGVYCSVEWPAYYLARCLLRLGAKIPVSSQRLWRQAIAAYMDYHWPKSMITGAPNHNAWKCLALHTGGLALGQSVWRERGLWSARQLAAYQSRDGVWDEPQRHHGPSPHYLSGVTRPMTMLAMDSGDPLVARMTARTRDFLLRFALPDGGTLGCLDSRAPYGIGQFNVGFATSARGRRLNRLSLETLVRHGLDGIVACAGSLHQAHGLAAAQADSLPYWRHGRQSALPQESDGYATRYDDGLQSVSLARANGWAVGMSATIAEICLRHPNPVKRDPQNRLDIWHARAGLIAGGGESHSVELGGADTMAVIPPPNAVAESARRGGIEMPLLANVVVVTGFGDGRRTACDFGLARSTSPSWIRGMIYPLAARILNTGARNALRLDFTHASVTITVRSLDENRLRIAFDIEHAGVPRLLLQLPLIVRDRCVPHVDGRPLPPTGTPARAGTPVRREIAIVGPADQPTVRATMPEQWRGRLRWPLTGGVGYRRALLSAQLDNPPRSCQAEFKLEVSAIRV